MTADDDITPEEFMRRRDAKWDAMTDEQKATGKRAGEVLADETEAFLGQPRGPWWKRVGTVNTWANDDGYTCTPPLDDEGFPIFPGDPRLDEPEADCGP